MMSPSLFRPFFVVFFCAALFSALPLAAQNGAGAAPGDGEPVETGPKRLSEEEVLERDIATSSITELADWCRMLGLSEAGTKDDLAARLRTHYRLETLDAAPADDGTGEESAAKPPVIITVDSARVSEYFTLDAVNEEYVRLKGGVSVSLKDGEITHTLKAEEILFNRTRNVMSASGGVEYGKQDHDTLETFKGEGITVNLDTWETVFMEGSSERALAAGANRYRFAGEVISRSKEDSTVLKNAVITNADNPEAYWSIAASKLWLLPGSDWAVFNAVLKVGEIPVLYLPYFYYPADEIVFHPVFGFRSREGTFLQTTTYLMGRPKAQGSAEESTISSIMGSGAGMEKKLEGVFLRSTGRKALTDDGARLSVQADAYANLGLYFGSELYIPSKGLFGAQNFSGGIGISRDIIQSSAGIWTPFAYDGTSHWHNSRFFDNEVPFRYRFLGEGSASFGGTAARGTFSWNFPLYSDPYMNNDFLHRSENSDLLNLLLSSSNPDVTVYTDSLGSYEWKLNGNLNFTFPSLSPFITTLSFSSISSSFYFDRKTTTPSRTTPPSNYPPGRYSYPPDAYFFHPSRFTAFSVSASAAGTPMTLDSTAAPQTGESSADTPDSFQGLGTPVPPWAAETRENADNVVQGVFPPELHPLPITRTAERMVFGGQKLVLDYNLTPSGAWEWQYNSENWTEQEDINWNDVLSQLYIVRADGNLGLTLSEARGLYTTSIRLYGTSSWQDYTYINYEATPFNTALKRREAKRNIHSSNRVSNSGEYNFTLRPFFGSDIWNATNFQYTLRTMLIQTKYDRSKDEWNWKYGAWNRDDIEIHRAQANFNANIMDKTQSLLLSADIPPEETSLSGDATARIWFTESNARTRILRPLEEDTFYEPLYLTETLRFTDKISLRQYAVLTPDVSEKKGQWKNWDWTMLTTSLTLWDLTASYTASRSKSYKLDIGNRGWYEVSSLEKLNPQQLSINYNKSLTTDTNGNFRLGLSVSSGLTFDLQRYTYSKFTFTLRQTTSINNFLDLSMSTQSENNAIFKYFYDHSDAAAHLAQKNPLDDLMNSFRFDNEKLRKDSGFKLKSFNLDLIHHLGDWDATLGIKLFPELDTSSSRPQYRFNTTVSFLMQWKPIKELKTDITYDKDGFRYE
jgi:lipopolysaccharide assembly outer membrane protein LptD (OstA)